MSAIKEMSSQCNNVQQENLIINETLTAEIERYKEQVKLFEQRQKFDLNDREKYIDGQLRKVIVDRNAKVSDFEKQIHSLKQQLNATVESHKILSTTVECLKKESKQKEDKYLDEVIDLQKKNKALDNVVYKMGQSKKVPASYDGHTIVKTHDALSVTDTEETLELAEKQLSAEQAFWLPISQTVSEKPPVPSEPVLKKEIPRELLPISLVKDSFHKMKEHVNKFDETITFHTKITGNKIGFWRVEHIKGAFKKDVKTFAQTLKEYLHMFEHGVYKELKKMKAVFNQMETEIAKCSVDKKYFEIEKKEISLDKDHLLEHIICQDDYIDEYSENLMLKAELAKKEHMVKKKILDDVVHICSRLENRGANIELKLQHQKESFLNNISFNNKNAPAILEFFKINEWQAKLDAKDVSIANLRKHIESLKGKNVVEKVATPNNAKVIALGMFKLDLEPLAPKVLNNRDAHIDYIKHSREHANTLQEIVEHARALKPLDSDLDSACKIVQKIQEVLVYVKDTCPCSTKPSEKFVAVTPLNKNQKVRMKSSTSASRSQPSGNTKNYRISQIPSSNPKNKVEDHPRSVKSNSNKKNRVIEPVCNENVKDTMWKPTRQTFTIDGKTYPLTRITSTKVDPLKETTSKSITTPNLEIKIYHRKTKVAKSVDLNSEPSCLNCSLVLGLRMLQAYDRKPLSAHKLR
ncbi:hypothetical protein Tco_1086005 [Tanacetum coccineum]